MQNRHSEGMVGSEFESLVLPRHLDYPDGGLNHYRSLPSLEQPHLLDGDELVLYHHSLHASNKASHLIAGAWCQIELAQVRDFEGKRAEAQELISWARGQALRCRHLVVKEQDHPDLYNRKHRAAMLGVYSNHFAQLGPVHWADEPTDFQKNAYALVQRELLDPVVRDFLRFQPAKDATGERHTRKLKGVLAQLVVLQSLNKLQAELEYP